MKQGEKILLGVFALVLLVGIGVAVFLLEEAGREYPPDAGVVPEGPVDDGDASGARHANPPAPPKPPARPELPLLEILVELRFDPYAPSNNRGAPERGSGRKSSLDGLVTDAEGRAVPGARLKFVAGLNAGEETATDAGGRYEFPRLYPGAQMVEVEIPGRDPIVREVRLLYDRPERANFHFAAPVDVAGFVLDRAGSGIAGAEVAIDRRAVTTDESGAFAAGAITPGNAIAYVHAKGYGPRRETLALRPGFPAEPDRVRFVLQKGGTLSGEASGAPPGGGAPTVAVYPDTPPVDRTFPFEEFGRVEIGSNGPFEVPGIPLLKLLRVAAFHPLAAAKPPHRTLFLREDGERNIVPVSFRFSPIPPVRGRVVDGETGKDRAGASVSLEVADLYRETVAALPGGGPNLTAYVLTPLPDLRSAATTDADGRFALGTGESRGWRWIAVAAEGCRTIERAVMPGREEVPHLVLFREETCRDGAELAVSFAPPREMRAALTLNGSPKAEEELAAGSAFLVSGLAPGIYAVRVRAGAATLFNAPELPIGRRREVKVPL